MNWRANWIRLWIVVVAIPLALSGPELASAIGSTTGQNSITCSIRAFRESAADILQSQLGLICEKQDIIRSGGPGYRYHEWITVRDKRMEAQEEDNHIGDN